MSGTPIRLRLVHGWGLGQKIWMPLLAYLNAAEVQCVDLVGYGGRALQAGGISDWADSLAQEAAPGEIWIASSLGALVATEVAERYPEKVAALITIGANPCFVERGGWPHGMPDGDFAFFEQAVESDPQAALNRFMSLAARGSQTERDDLRHLRALGSATSTANLETLRAGLDTLRDTDARQQWRSLSCPCLHMLAEHDALVTPALLQFHQQSGANQQTSLLGGASHLPWLGRPREVAEIIQRWVESLPK